MARLYFRLGGLMLFRWGGEYTWTVTGPVSAGYSEPLPPPTTLIGATLGTRRGAELEEDEVLEGLGERLGCRPEALRGPYYPADGGIAIHSYPGGLLIVDGEGVKGLVEAPLSRHTGLALTRTAKTAARGLLYRASLLDPLGLIEESIQPELSIDLVGCNSCTAGGTVKLGGDMRLATIACDGRDTLLKLIEGFDGDEAYCIVASPLLLPVAEKEAAKRLLKGEEVEVSGAGGACKLRAPSIRELTRLLGREAERLAKRVRVRVELIHPGVYGDTGFPRRPHLAILPGAILYCRGCSRDTLLKGLGRYSKLGFGTLLPLPPRE